jgi:hypothetical protein
MAHDTQTYSYVLRPAVFEYRRLILETLAELEGMLADLPVDFLVETPGGRLILSGSGSVNESHLLRIEEALEFLGDRAVRASITEQWIDGVPKVAFFGPASGLINSARREYASLGWKRFKGRVHDLFVEFPTLQSFRTWIVSQRGGLQCLGVSGTVWGSGRAKVSDRELAAKLTDFDIEIDLSLVDGKGFFREDFASLRERTSEQVS